MEPGQIILDKSAQFSNDGGGLESGFQTLPQRSLAAERSLVPTRGWGTDLATLFFILPFFVVSLCVVAVLSFKFMWNLHFNVYGACISLPDKGSACLGDS